MNTNQRKERNKTTQKNTKKSQKQKRQDKEKRDKKLLLGFTYFVFKLTDFIESIINIFNN